MGSRFFFIIVMTIELTTLAIYSASAKCPDNASTLQDRAEGYIPETKNKFNYILAVTIKEITNEITRHSQPPEGILKLNQIIRGDSKIREKEEHKFVIEMPECAGDRNAAGKLTDEWLRTSYRGPAKGINIIVFGKFYSGSIKDGFRIRGNFYLDTPENRQIIRQQMDPKTVAW